MCLSSRHTQKHRHLNWELKHLDIQFQGECPRGSCQGPRQRICLCLHRWPISSESGDGFGKCPFHPLPQYEVLQGQR